MDCVRKLCDAIDTDFDDRIALVEIREYINLKELPIADEIVD